jgi:hypothetical protein
VRGNTTQQIFQFCSKLVLAKQSQKFDNLTGDKVMFKRGGFSFKTNFKLIISWELRIENKYCDNTKDPFDSCHLLVNILDEY